MSEHEAVQGPDGEEETISQVMLPDGRIFLGRVVACVPEQLVIAQPAYVAGDGTGNAAIQCLEKPHASFQGPMRIANPHNVILHELDPASEIVRAYRAARSGIHLPQGGVVRPQTDLRVISNKGTH
jgi:hypothetical protein